MKKWFLYMVCGTDGSLYTGITTDIAKRVETHNKGMGAKALKGKLPVTLVYSENFDDGTAARKREAEIKSWTRIEKLKLVEGVSGA
jgi:putative endonuclease